MIRVCFVCLGNICRSPTAEGVMRALVEEAGLTGTIDIDSAGTSGYHVGDAPDRRSAAAAARHGVTLAGRSRQFQRSDFQRFDYVVAMDQHNFQDLQSLTGSEQERQRLSLMRDHEPGSDGPRDVPDPYYCGGDGFERVYQICLRSCQGLLQAIRAQKGL